MRKTALASILFAGALLAVAVAVEAQQPKKVYRMGYLAASDRASDSARSEAIRLALRDLGYVEGHNIAFEYRYAAGKTDRYAALAEGAGSSQGGRYCGSRSGPTHSGC